MRLMSSIPVGAQHEVEVVVDERIAINFLGREEARVLATPWLIAYLEMVSRDLVKPYLSEGEDTVGTEVCVRHLAATPMGMRVRFRSEIAELNGRRVKFRVEAQDEKEKICEGTHERFIIDIERFARRAQEKKAGRG